MDNDREFKIAQEKLAYFAICYKTHLETGSSESYLADSLKNELIFKDCLSKLDQVQIDSLSNTRAKYMERVNREFLSKAGQRYDIK